ncbi:ribbon-helix-helix protein, CopG family [Algibacter mikhailovii]|uniref:ribbon-helix-helix protein, CopG family n=1 Tax=Algibacter mikhailovii TaxID=425498 RepID=UPI00249467CF|nr:ribbon-helix-helix protein, CopG family [Algibacter mikhailovii]
MAKVNKIDNRDPSINFRLPKELKNQLEELAYGKNQTTSKFIRILLEHYLTGELYKDAVDFYKRHHFITSLEFIQLLIWIYEKRKSNDYLESDEEILPGIISTLKRTDMHLPKDLAMEFDKVLFDIMRSQNEQSKYSKSYVFFDHYHDHQNFNLKKVEDYLKNFKIPD